MDREKFKKRGKNYLREMGSWRLEISPAKPAKFDNFLHLLYPTDTKTENMPAAEMVVAKDQKMIGLAVAGWLVMFGKKGEVKGEISYEAPKGKTEHLVVDLKREAVYKVTGITGGEKVMKASKEGTLRFATEKAGEVKVSLTK